MSPPISQSRIKQGQLPSPITHKESTASEGYKEGTVSPPSGRPSQPVRSPRGPGGLSSPPSETQATQAFSQFVYPPDSRAYAVDDEEGKEVWGYLLPMEDRSTDTSTKVMVLCRREACPVPTTLVGKQKKQPSKGEYKEQEENYENEKQEKGVPAGGYLIGRHRECGKSFHVCPHILCLTTSQIVSSNHPSFRTGTAFCSPRRRAETPLP